MRRESSPILEKKATILVIFLWWILAEKFPLVMITADPPHDIDISETRLVGNQEQNRTFPGSFPGAENARVFRGFPSDRLHPRTENWKDLMRPGVFSLKGIAFVLCFFFFFFFSSSFFVCEQRLKGIIYSLVVKAHNVLDLVHRKECVTLWCGQI